MTSKEMDDEKKGMLQTIERLKMENQRLLEELRMKKSDEHEENMEVSPEKQSYLSLPSLASIVTYIAPTNRFVLSLYYLQFRIFEKSIPLNLTFLGISPWALTFDDKSIRFEKGSMLHFNRFRSSYIVTGGSIEDSEGAVTMATFDLFAGRTKFGVEKFEIIVDIPFGLSLDVGTLFIPRTSGLFLTDYRKWIRGIDCLIFYDITPSNDLRDPWFRNMQRLEKLGGDHSNFIAELPDLRAETIYINFEDSTHHRDRLLFAWCHTRNGRIGSKLFITTLHLKEARFIGGVIAAIEEDVIGFVRTDDGILVRRLENNAKIRFSVRNDKDHFSKDFLSVAEQFTRYICFEVVNS